MERTIYLDIDNALKGYKEPVKIFTDGSTINNGKVDARGGIGIWFGEDDERNVSIAFKDKPTNQRCELMAIYHALQIANTQIDMEIPIIIGTDSMYSINCVTKWMDNWKQNGWKTANRKDVKNKNILQNIDQEYQKRKNISFHHIRAHTKKLDEWSVGNEMADELARNAANYK